MLAKPSRLTTPRPSRTQFLLPFSLSSSAKGGYDNPSLIAMFVLGPLFLVAYTVYEWKWARFPSSPIRLIKNRTFATAVIIDFIYMVAGYLQLNYLSSCVALRSYGILLALFSSG